MKKKIQDQSKSPAIGSSAACVKGNKASVEGVITFNRSERDDADQCVCCNGAHIYGYHFEVPRVQRIFAGLETESVDDFINDWVWLLPDIENKRVRLTLEIIE